jgi:hypothetical protein
LCITSEASKSVISAFLNYFLEEKSLKITDYLLDRVAHTYNPSPSGVEIRRIMVQGQLGQLKKKMLARPYLKEKNGTCGMHL